MNSEAKPDPPGPGSPTESRDGWDETIAQWRAKHQTPDDHPALLCAQILRLHYDETTAAQEQRAQEADAIRSDIASLGEGFTGIEKNLLWVMDELKRKPAKPTATSIPLSIVLFVTACMLLAGFCLGRAFS